MKSKVKCVLENANMLIFMLSFTEILKVAFSFVSLYHDRQGTMASSVKSLAKDLWKN